jgi:O-antigen ligase
MESPPNSGVLVASGRRPEDLALTGLTGHLKSGRRIQNLSVGSLSIYFGAHILLSVMAQRSPAVGTVWALSALAVGLVAFSRRDFAQSLVVFAAYIMGAELIWRATRAGVFWEYGKYVILLSFSVALLRLRRRRIQWWAVVFLVCLVPSLFVLPYFDRREVAFNLSGPVVLGLAMLVFSAITVDRQLLLRLSAVALGPIVGLSFLATLGTLTADPRTLVVYGKATTAGFGPNQVSSILGLGLFLVFILLLVGPQKSAFRLFLGAIGVWLGAQTVLSFSRGGLWTTAGAMLVASYFLVQERKRRRAIILLAVLGFVLSRFVVFPATDRISRGIASRRAVDTDLTGRDQIMKADWIVFRENPVFGVGPGQSYGAHAISFRASSPHTEYTRLLAEHGSFGVIAILILGWMTLSRWRRREPALEKGIGLSFLTWALLYMAHSAMRLSAPALCFGLGMARLLADESPLVNRRWRVVFRHVRFGIGGHGA